MRSWSYLIQIRAVDKEGREEESSALYIVALPPDEELLKVVEMECYASHYMPRDTALRLGRAYAVGTDIKVENPEDYGFLGYREDMDLYVFKEGLSFEEGLINVYRLLLKDLSERMELEYVYPVVDVGSPEEEVMLNCLKKSLSA